MPQFQDDIDDFMTRRKTPALKPVQPADDDIDGFMSKRATPAPTLFTGERKVAPSDLAKYPVPVSVPSLASDKSAKASLVGYYDTPSVDDPNSPVGRTSSIWAGTDTDASGRETGAGLTYFKNPGVAPRPRAVNPRARQAAQVARKIEQSRNEATRLFKQADATPMERMGGAFDNQQQLRAQAEGKLEQANILAKNAQQDFGDVLEVGFGKDADPNSKREWAYAKPKAPKVREEWDAQDIQRGDAGRFADPRGELNQGLNVSPEQKQKFARQRGIEQLRGQIEEMNPITRYGLRAARGLLGDKFDPEAEQEVFAPVGIEEDVNRIAQSGAKGVGSIVRGGATMLPYAFPAVDTVTKAMTGKPLRAYTEGIGRTGEGIIGRAAENVLPENLNDQSFKAKLERGAGSLVPSIGGAALTGGGSLAAGALGALTNLGQVATERDKSGVPVSDVRRVSSDALAVATGMTEALGMGRLLNRVGLGTPLVKRVAQMVEEGGQEYAQDYLNDINAKLVAAYDPQRQVNDPLAAKRLEAAAIGAILGGAGEVADYTGGKIQNQIAAPAIRSERAPMPGIRPTAAPGPTNIIPLSRTAAAAPSATPALAIDPTVTSTPKSTIEPTELPVAAESQPSAIDRSQYEPGETGDLQFFVDSLLAANVAPAPSVSESGQVSAPVETSQTMQSGQTAQLPAQQTATGALRAEADAAKIKAAEFEQTGDFGQAAATHEATHKNLKLLRRKLGVPKTAEDVARINQIDREVSIAATNMQKAKVQARQMAKQANAPTVDLPKPATFSQPKTPQPQVQQADTRNISAPLLRPEAVQEPSKRSNAIFSEIPKSSNIPQVQQNQQQDVSSNFEDIVHDVDSNTSKPETSNILPVEQPAAFEAATPKPSSRKRRGGEARNLGGREGNALVGLVNKNSKTGIDDAVYALHEEGLRLPDGRPFVEDGRVVASEGDILDYLRQNGKQKVGGTKSLNKNLANEEAEYYAQDEIAAKVDADTDTGALRRSIARSEERGHVAPSPGMGLVSMSPYADMVARNSDAVDRLYEVGAASAEGRQILRDLQGFADKNGIERRHVGNLANAIKNYEMDKAFWKEQGLSLETVQQAIDSESALQDQIREATAKLPENQRTAIEREVAALDELFDDAEAMNLLDRAIEGDNNAANDFKQTAGEYGIEPDTAAELIGTRRDARSVRQAEASKARGQNAGAQASARQSTEARSPTTDEFDLLIRNPATIPTDEFDDHVRSLEELRNNEIRGIVKMSRDDKRALIQQSKNTNEERKFRVRRKEMPAKFESRVIPVGKEDLTKAAKQSEADVIHARAKDRRLAATDDMRGLNPTEEDWMTSEEKEVVHKDRLAQGRKASEEQAAAKERVKEKRAARRDEPAPIKTGDSVTWQSGGKTEFGKVTKVNGQYVTAETADGETITRDKSKFRADGQNAPSVARAATSSRAPESNYWKTPRVESAPVTDEDGQKVVADSRVEFRQSKRGAGTLWTNHQAAIVIASAANQTGADPGAASGFAGLSMSHRTVTMTADLLREKADGYGADGKRLTEIADALETAQADAIANNRDDVVIADSTSADNLSEAKRLLREERFHSWQRGAGLFDKNVSRALDATLGRNPTYRRIKEVLLEEGYNNNPRILTTEAAAKAASGQWERYGLKSEDEALDFLNEYYRASARMLGVDALMENAPATPQARKVQENVRTEEKARLGSRIRSAQTEKGRAEQGSANAPSLGRRNESRRNRRGQEANAGSVSKGKRSSLGSLANEPTGEVLGVGLGGLQKMLGRKPTTPKTATKYPIPRGFDFPKWSQKTLNDALVAILPKRAKAQYAKATTSADKKKILAQAKLDPKAAKEILGLMKRVQAAVQSGDGGAVYDLLLDAKENQVGRPARSKAKQAWEIVANLPNDLRTLMTTGEFSFMLRQGGIMTLPPQNWARAVRSLRRASGMTLSRNPFERYRELQKEVFFHPDYQDGKERGLYLAIQEEAEPASSGKREDDYYYTWAGKLPPVKWFENANKAYLDLMRLEEYSKFKKSILRDKLPAEEQELALDTAADFVNKISGRGSLGEWLDAKMPQLAKLLFSPRWLASRINMLNPAMYTNMPMATRKQALVEVGSYAGMVSTALLLAAAAGASVNWDDPNDPDWLKIKIGNTRYDILSGNQQILRFIWSLGKAAYKRGSGDKVSDRDNPVNILLHFLRGKMSPGASLGVDWWTQKDFIGRDFTWKRALIERVTPIMQREMVEAYQKGDNAGIAKQIPAIWGVGVQDYEKKVGVLKENEFTEEAAKTGHEYDFIKKKPDEPESVYKDRVQRVEGWMDVYGKRLISDPRYRNLSPDMQEAAIESLRRRIGRQQNIKAPKLDRAGRIESFGAGKIFESIQKSATEKPKEDAKKIWVAPPR